MNATLLTDSQSHMNRFEPNPAATYRRDAVQGAIARTLLTTADWLWRELEEAEHLYLETRKARNEQIPRPGATELKH